MSPTKDRTRGIVGITTILAMLAVLGWVLLTPTGKAGPAPSFVATFDTPSDFFDRFDFGYSGVSQNEPQVNGQTHYMGDHDSSCGAPTTFRDVNLLGVGPNVDYSQLFWWCAPGGAGTGHVMTGLNTFGYNHLWFSPKSTFTSISSVCWSINETEESSRKWTEVQFVGDEDAHRYPTGTIVDSGVWARGTGGFDLGYGDPGARAGDATTSIIPGGDPAIAGGTVPGPHDLAGLKIVNGIFAWWQNGDQTMADQVGWPGMISGYTGILNTDKATRYKHCLTQVAPGTLQIDEDRPANVGGHFTAQFPGQIPQDARRVVFHDSTYDAAKAENYDPNFLTWHWDDIQVFTDGVMPTTTTTTAPTTTSTEPPTTEPPTTTTEPTTTSTEGSTTTTQPSQPDQLTWIPRADNAALLDGFLGTVHLFTIRERAPDTLGRYPNRPWVLSTYLGYPTSRLFFDTLDEAKASAEQQLDDFQTGTGLGP